MLRPRSFHRPRSIGGDDGSLRNTVDLLRFLLLAALCAGQWPALWLRVPPSREATRFTSGRAGTRSDSSVA